MWISGPTKGLENIFLLLQSTSNPDKRVYGTFDTIDQLLNNKIHHKKRLPLLDGGKFSTGSFSHHALLRYCGCVGVGAIFPPKW